MVAKLTSMLIVCAFGLVGAIDQARGAPAASGSDEAGLSADVKFCEKLEKYRPVDPKASFSYPTTKKVYGWTLITGGKGAFAVNHTGYKNGKEVCKHRINVRGGRYPTWSFLFVTKGAYKLEVSDEEGKVFAQGEFTVN